MFPAFSADIYNLLLWPAGTATVKHSFSTTNRILNSHHWAATLPLSWKTSHQCEGRDLDLLLTTAKCKIITSDITVVAQLQHIAHDIIHFNPQSAVLLGTPVSGEHPTKDVSAKVYCTRPTVFQLNILDCGWK